ncbi:capsule biosynthesis protein [Rhodobium gokarnense]|uniref:Capsular polysaccharide export protein n=1 Tax=Rhodobium gokarnense TaxID=364296 RepID=A0ABT3HAC6_9HYPH|nr:capsular biosynthesis protein [Rhodobium gokarnense]MCW2307309.1 capsular polysaccharide export protein [Rhodobium gokarnense]
MPIAARHRTFLFLQGPLSPLYARLADALEGAGSTVHRINLCFGDWLHWRRPGAVAYRGRVRDWPDFVDRFMADNGITDLILHGDRRIYHRLAADCARHRSIRVIATELGYLRPDWMTIERDATSTGSHFPDDPDAIRAIAEKVPEPDLTPIYRGSFFKVAFPDVVYNLSNVLFTPLWPHYRRHTIYHPVPEYLAWIARLASEKRRNREAGAVVERLKRGNIPFFVFPMQLEGDFQIRDHSPFDGMADALRPVIASFAANAPEDAHLLIKGHPLDNGLENWPKTIGAIVSAYDLEDRIHYLDGGRLDEMLPFASGMVTVNSTAGIEALMHGCPTKTLTPAIYDIEGLTDRRELYDFWSAPEPPDEELLAAFIRALTGTVQVRGSIYNDDGLKAAVENMAERILSRRLNMPDAYVDPPPRLDRARALGAPL